MPTYLLGIMRLFSIILWALLFYISIRDVNILYKRKSSSLLANLIKIGYLMLIILLISSFLILPPKFNIQINRNAAIESIKQLSEKQKVFYSKNDRYARTFEELGCPKANMFKCIKTAKYTYYMNDDKLYQPGSVIYNLPTYIKVKNNKIYAVCKLSSYSTLDIISIDYKSKIEVIESFAWWLPY